MGEPAPDPRGEAEARLDGRYAARVLEPSPPAVDVPPWYADDPVAVAPADRDGRPIVSPVGTGDVTWDELARDEPGLAEWCADRWLGAWRRLGPPPQQLVTTRWSLHRVAEHVLAPTRARANGKVGLRWTRGGFGTPFFGAGAQLRVERDELLVVRGGEVWRGRIGSIKDAAEFVGFDLTRFDEELDDSAPLAIDVEASGYIGDVFGFGCSVLEQLRAEVGPGQDPSRVQLWPEHFDLAFEFGDEDAGRRAGYGIAPGDEQHDEPYLYVVPWERQGPSPVWNATAFRGAELPLAELLEAPDQRAAALAFYRGCSAHLDAA